MSKPYGIVALWHGRLLRDRGARAAIRRAQTWDEVLTVPAFLDLYRRIHAAGIRMPPEILARMALAVSEVEPREEAGEEEKPEAPPELRPGRVFGRPRRGEDRAPVSFDRLRRLVETEEPDLFVRLLRAALVQVEGEGHPVHLSRLVHAWHFPAERLSARRRLLLDYAETAPESEFPQQGETS
ncbi:hypothetical protein HRbin39_00891 [bacterium HR39]|nr:hypothetical protein HRbin39_00891 [bacterium HR39]